MTKIKNYTSTVSTERTIARIEEVLAEAGVSSISKEYNQGRLAALMFKIAVPGSQELTIRLPAKYEAVYAALCKKVKRPHEGTLDRLKDQAMRTAWKLMQDWVEVQLTLIYLGQAEFLQVFLSYVYNGKQTYYEALKASNYRALLEEGGKHGTA